jgi:hypothetical protein
MRPAPSSSGRSPAAGAHLFVFLENRAIPATNNGSEQALRHCVVFRGRDWDHDWGGPGTPLKTPRSRKYWSSPIKEGGRILVTSEFHMPRALGALGAAGLSLFQ